MRLDELAAHIGAELIGDGSIDIHGVSTLDEAQPGEVTFLSNPRYAAKVATTQASAIIVPPEFKVPTGVAALRAVDPYGAMAKALALFFRPRLPTPGIHPTAVVHPTVRLGAGASVSPYAVIEAEVRIGARAVIGPHVVIGAGTTIGDDFTAHAHASVRERVQIGDRVTLQNGAVIGGDGFGYVVSDAGTAAKLSQAGTVVLEDDVEIGANSTVDRATIGATRIRRGAKIDNLVMIAHGCDVGEFSFLAGQSGLAGSSKLGRGVQLAGQVGVAGHLTIGDFARVAAQAGVHNDIPAQSTVGGSPAIDVAVWRRAFAALPKLPELLRRVRRLERTRDT